MQNCRLFSIQSKVAAQLRVAKSILKIIAFHFLNEMNVWINHYIDVLVILCGQI